MSSEFWSDVPHIVILVMETDQTLEQLIKTAKSKRTISERRRVINGFDAFEKVFTVGQRPNGILPVSPLLGKFYIVKEVFLVQKGRLYDIGFYAPEMSEYRQYLPLFEKSIQTFHIISKEQEEIGPSSETYKNKELGFSFTPPVGWNIREFPQQFLFYPLDEHVLAKMIKTGDVEALYQIFMKARNWDTREWAVVALERIFIDKVPCNKKT